MNRVSIGLMSVAVLFGASALVGCDREVASEREVDVRGDGGVEVQDTRVIEQPDGGIRVEEYEEVQTPQN